MSANTDLTKMVVEQYVKLSQDGQLDEVKFWRHHPLPGFQAQYTITFSHKGKVVWSSKGQARGLLGVIEDDAKAFVEITLKGWKRLYDSRATHGAVSYFAQA